MKRPKISCRAETRPYGRVSAPTRNCRRFLTQLLDVFGSHVAGQRVASDAGVAAGVECALRWLVREGHAVAGKPPSRLPVLIIRVYNSGLEGVLGSGGFDAEAIHGGVSSG